MNQRTALKVCTVLWAVFLILKTREVFYDVRSFLREETMVGFVQGWGPVSGFIRTWKGINKNHVEILALVGYVFDLTVMAVLPTMERKLTELQGKLTCGWMLCYVPRCLMVLAAYIGLRGVRPGFIYVGMLMPMICGVLMLREIINESR